MDQKIMSSTGMDGAPLGAGGNSEYKNTKTPFYLLIAAMLGIGALFYSSAADWFATLGHNSEVSSYVRQIEQMPGQERTEKLRTAYDYNSSMPHGVLRDPYTAGASDVDPSSDPGYRAYLDAVSVDGNDVIGEVSYPSLNISLPLYHGTNDDVLRKGVGHLYGSSLPVGGPSTHAVLTSHSGLLNASLFTDLLDAEIGDIFTVSVLGETRYYKVQHIETVLPEQTESLRIVNGQDRVTLITCTPIGINSHRLLVQADRVDAPPGAPDTAVASTGKSAGFPWWALGFIAGSALAAFILFKPMKQRSVSSRTNTEDIFEQREERR